MASNTKKAALLAQQGASFHQAGRIDLAEDCYRRSLALDPKNIDALHLLGVVQRMHDKLDQAAQLIAKSLQINPRQHGALNNLGEVELCRGNFEQAARHLSRALKLAPDLQPAWVNQCVALSGSGRNQEAEAAFAEAIARYPDNGELRSHFAEFLIKTGREALARQQIELAQGMPTRLAAALKQRASVYAQLMMHDQAAACYREMIKHDPEDFSALVMLRHQLDLACDWSERAPMLQQIRETAQRQMAEGLRPAKRTHVADPFVLLSLFDDPALHLHAARQYAATLPTPGPLDAAAAGTGTRDGRIRIGYLSADFHAHATAYLLAGVLEHHDRARFEVFAYSTGPDDASPTRARIRAACEHFIDLAGMSSTAVAKRIAADGIDILVDLKGYTTFSKSEVMRARPAPVQVNYLGYPGSLGMEEIDYIIADPVVIPAAQRAHYSEKVVRLPACYQPNDDRRVIDARPSRASEGLPEHALVLYSFNRTNKLSPEIFDVWCEALEAHDKSVLWLLSPGQFVADNLRREAESRGIDGARLVFAQPLPPDRHWARHALADLFLDSYPYGAHTTASDALWMGVPLITLAGSGFASRVAASILGAAGVPQLAASDIERYRALILRFVTEPDWRRSLRWQIEASARKSPLFATEKYTRELEWAFAEMWRRKNAGLPAADFDVPEQSRGAANKPAPLTTP